VSIGASLLPELDQEVANTRRALERIPDGAFSYKPHDKSFSMMELANHLARIPGWGSATLTTDSMDLDPEKGEFVPPDPAETVQAVLEVFDEGARGLRAALEAASDEELMKPWTLTSGDQVFFTMPRIAVIRGMILNHMIHHRGQLTVYLRLNDLPVPALYGPSADEDGS
jgi:uncharacterized damage-inducible protein DinB